MGRGGPGRCAAGGADAAATLITLSVATTCAGVRDVAALRSISPSPKASRKLTDASGSTSWGFVSQSHLFLRVTCSETGDPLVALATVPREAYDTCPTRNAWPTSLGSRAPAQP